MAKGMNRGNREVKKPKAAKKPTAPAGSGFIKTPSSAPLPTKGGK